MPGKNSGMSVGKIFVVLVPFICLAVGNLLLLLGRRLSRPHGAEAVGQVIEVAKSDTTYVEHFAFTKHLFFSQWDGTFILALSALIQWILLGCLAMVGVSALFLFSAGMLGLWMAGWPPRYYLDARLLGRWWCKRVPLHLLLVITFRLIVIAASAVAAAMALLGSS